MTTPDRIDDLLLEELWEEKINDRLLKYPHIPGAKLFNKLSAECWNEVYMQKEEVFVYYIEEWVRRERESRLVTVFDGGNKKNK